MKNQLTDTEISLLMKSALEYNASIITACAHYYGNIKSKNSQNRFVKVLKYITKEYQNSLDNIIKIAENDRD